MAKKKNSVLLIGLILILVLAIGLSYGYYLLSKVQENNNVVGSKCFNLELASEENNINLNNMYPISDEEGKSLTPYTFTLKNTCDMTASYTLSMEMLEGTTLNSKYVDVMVNNGEIKLLTSYDETNTVLTGSTESRILDKGLLASNSSKDYSIRFWMDKDVEDTESMNKAFQSKIIVDSTPINYDGQVVYDFDYTGGEQTFIAPVSGTYRLETWGAQGGGVEATPGGLGGYSSGIINLETNNKIYINVGGKGEVSENVLNAISIGGYNGGGNGLISNKDCDFYKSGSGGGATHMASDSGLLNTFENKKSNLLVVSSGGGGGNYCNELNHANGGDGGGYKGKDAYNLGAHGVGNGYGFGASQSNAGCNIGGDCCGGFGAGYSGSTAGLGGGGGFYGGGSSSINGAGGGSGYIGNSLLKNKVMYCYDCEESNEESTKTISTTCNEETPTSYCAKKGNGYARITLVSIDEYGIIDEKENNITSINYSEYSFNTGRNIICLLEIYLY